MSLEISGRRMTDNKDYTGSKVGMWLFLFSELLFFGGLFLLYSVYRAEHSQEFHIAAGELNTLMGTINTIILLTSSLTIAVSIRALKKNDTRLSIIFNSATIILAVLFLINKYFEWSVKFEHGLYPDSPLLLEKGKGIILFFGLYFIMTGLHGLHILAGIVLLSVMLILTVRGRINSSSYILLENSGLYWHFVDIIWIFLFPLFYLIT